MSDCDAVCVSMGPGSYTGLRVGVSTAKGLCFGSGKPLIAVGTLDTLVAQAQETPGMTEGIRYIVPMVDARRMEVYSAVFDPEGHQITETSPVIVDGDSFAGYLAEGGPADLVLFDADKEWIPESFVSKSQNTPFLGQKLTGQVVTTICKGKVVYQA